MSDLLDMLNAAVLAGNSSAPGLLHSLSTAAASAGASSSHLTGLAQLAVLALLAFPIWLFGLLIGLLLPQGTFTVSDSQLLDDSADAGSSTSSRASDTPGISSRPLSDEDLSDSESDAGEGVEQLPYVHAAQPSRTGNYDTTCPSLSHIAVGPASSIGAVGKMAPAAAGKATHTVAWAQHLVGQQHQSHKYVSPTGPSTPDASYTSRAAIKAPEPMTSTGHQHSHQRQHGPRTHGCDRPNHHHYHQQPQAVPVHAANPFTAEKALVAAGHDRALRHFGSGGSGRSRSLSGSQAGPHWFVTEDDLDKFVETVQPVEGKLLTGNIGPEWSLIMDKEVPGVVRYLSYWRPTENGTTDYLSVTIIPDATAQEIHEFNLDDACRVSWDPMLSQTWLLSSRDTSAAEQLVVWMRSFPMGFLSDRLYSGIARRTFPDTQRPGSSVYGVTKVVKSPASTAWAAEHYPGVIQTDNYFSAWRCRTIPSPWDAEAPSNSNSRGNDGMPRLTIKTTPGAQSPAGGIGGSSKPACELILLHHDELKVPEYLSRLAIKVGMWKFVTGMVDAAGAWLEERRTRCDPFRDDPQAACRRAPPPLSGAAAAAAATAAVPESPFSPLARQRPQPGIHPSSGTDSVDAVDALLSPRWLYAVPTAPDLTLLAVAFEGQSDSTGVPSPSAGNAFENELPRKSPALRRGHSLEWEPKPDDTAGQRSTAGSRMNTRCEASDHDSATAVAHPRQQQQQQQQQQQPRFGVGPVQLSLQPLRMIAGAVSAAGQSVANRVPATLRDLFKGPRRAESPRVVVLDKGAVAPGFSEGQPESTVNKATINLDKGVVSQAVEGNVGGVLDSDTSADDLGDLSQGRDQLKLAAHQRSTAPIVTTSRSAKRGHSSRAGKAQTVRRFVVGGALVYAAVGILKLLAGSGQQGHAVRRDNRTKGQDVVTLQSV